ncbi:MAG: WG repeat-containing protein [Cyanobacteria bacterium P01_G01_bin.39]
MHYWEQGDELNNGKYVVEKLLGSGGFGVTYKIKHTRNNRLFALKSLNIEARNRPDFEQLQVKFINEAIALASCRHPNIVRVYPQVFQQDGLWCMVMEYVEGEDLACYLDEHGKLTEEDAIAIITKVGKALAYVHQQGFLHRDIKPANILLRKADLSPVLIDFGLAREYTPGTIRSMTNSKTERYAPIEQYQRNGNFGAWTDVYALAATLYTLLTERPPIPSEVRKEVASNILIPPKQHNPEISDRINEAILKGMELEPGDRPQSVEKWLVYLIPAIEKSGVSDRQISNHIPKPIQQPNNLLTNIDQLCVIKDDFESAHSFSNGLAAVKKYGKWGYIDKKGNEVIPFQYDDAWSFREGLAAVKQDTVLEGDGKWGYIDKKGNEIIPFKFNSSGEFYNGLLSVSKKQYQYSKYSERKYGYVNKKGQVVISYKFDQARDFHEGLAAVKLLVEYRWYKRGKFYNKWGFINKKGREVIPFQFDQAWNFCEGLAAIQRDDKWGFINSYGNQIIPCQYNDVRSFKEGLAAVRKDGFFEGDGKWGYIDKTGRELIPGQFYDARDFSEGLAAVKNDDGWLYIDKTGKQVTFTGFYYAQDFSEGLALVHKLDIGEQETCSFSGYIDKNGAFIIPYQRDFGSCGNFQEGLALLSNNSNKVYIHNPLKQR